MWKLPYKQSKGIPISLSFADISVNSKTLCKSVPNAKRGIFNADPRYFRLQTRNPIEWRNGSNSWEKLFRSSWKCSKVPKTPKALCILWKLSLSVWTRLQKLLQVHPQFSLLFNNPLLRTRKRCPIQHFPSLSPTTRHQCHNSLLMFRERDTTLSPLRHVLHRRRPLERFLIRSFQFHHSILHNRRFLPIQLNNISIRALQLTILFNNINLCNIRIRRVMTINLCPMLTLNLVLEILMKMSIFDCFNFFIALYR